MTTRYDSLATELRAAPRRWLLTGGAGFIGSNLLERLLELDQHVTVLDDYSTGSHDNLAAVAAAVGPERWARARVVEGDIRDPAACADAAEGVDHVLHQAALGSVPRSMADPMTTHHVNVDGFLQVLLAARDVGAKSVVYASSSSVYGDSPTLPKIEGETGDPLSPYAASKACNEVYAAALGHAFGLKLAGLRYFNVFGPRQSPDGPYAAVIPRWLDLLARGGVPVIHGDGETSRDFCPVENVVQVNLLAAIPEDEEAFGRAYNVALGGRITLNQLVTQLRDGMAERGAPCARVQPSHGPFRPGDVRHSQANTSLSRRYLGYVPALDFAEGLERTMDWFVRQQSQS